MHVMQVSVGPRTVILFLCIQFQLHQDKQDYDAILKSTNNLRSFIIDPTMKHVLLLILALCFSLLWSGLSRNVSAIRPPTVHIGALFSHNSTIGRVVRVAIDAAVSDVNADPSVLQGTKLVVEMQDSNSNSFSGIVQVIPHTALQFMETDIVAIVGLQSSIIAHVISHVIVIFVEDDYGRNGITSLGDKLSEKRYQISYKAALQPGATRDDIMDLLVKVALMASRIIVVHVNPSIGIEVFVTARYLGMVSNGYVWIATDWLSSFLDSSTPLDKAILDTMQGVLVLRQHTVDSKLKNTLISRWSQLTKKGTTENFHLNSYGLYAYDTVWLVSHALDAFFNDGGSISFSNFSNLHDAEGGNLHLEAMSVFDGGQILLNNIHNVNFDGVTGKVQFDSEANLIRPAYDILKILGTGWRTIGYWTNYSGLSIMSPEELYMNRANSSSANQQLYNVIWPGEVITKPRGWVFPNNGKELRIVVPKRVSYREFVSIEPDSDGVKGYCIDVFTAAIDLLPYPVPYKFIPFGNGHENPNYAMLAEMVASGDFDAAIGDIAIVTIEQRLLILHNHISNRGLSYWLLEKLNSDAWAFLQPFTVEMWCVIGLSLLIIGIAVWILEHRINDEFRGPPKKQLVTVFSFSFSTLFFTHRENTMSTLGRVVLLIWLFLVLVLQSSYTASLTSILTVQQLSSPVKCIDSLIAGNEPIGFQVGSFAENYLVEVLGISRSRLKALGTPNDYVRALELGPKNGGVAAVVDERPYIELFLSIQCKFSTVGSEFTRNGWGFTFPRDSPLAVDLSTNILTLSENGDHQRIHNKWLTGRGLCSSQTSELESDRLQFNSFWGLFLICGMACAVALFIYFAIMVHQYIRHYPLEESDSSCHGSSKSGCSLQRFFSFIDEKDEDVKSRKMLQAGNSSLDSERHNIFSSNKSSFGTHLLLHYNTGNELLIDNTTLLLMLLQPSYLGQLKLESTLSPELLRTLTSSRLQF
ncbi:hypothetical protein OPV22_005553 [Ensete ventricosum]|uniref:Glutamate receptor n=1 Tax=Ensete ventricosum TaxID=4639 RepID=A0AAV8Q9F4_ENSVE|nr:hypothetical protein OPV22_005553 [Ensete ventricosum]